MKRKLHFIAALMGIVAGNAWNLRGTIASIKSLGLREHVAIHAALLRIGVNLGAREAVKLVRLIGAIALELCPDPRLMDEMLRVAVAGSGMGLTPQQILPLLHRMARKVAAWHPSGVPANG